MLTNLRPMDGDAMELFPPIVALSGRAYPESVRAVRISTEHQPSPELNTQSFRQARVNR